jgi:hypothetical protein
MIEMFGIHKGRGLMSARLKLGLLHASMRKVHPNSELEKRTLGNPERTQSKPKISKSEYRPNPDSEPRTANPGFAVVLDWVRSVL